ncbi:hypothetical protein LEP1GSC005_1427 [Leptospira santarosai str. ST188]|nr:hypothetical protein LEP1GSC005_1427 [Leptospira santarosai str. ST188]EMO24457.1 hypothetical protein LEP1GSC168_3412 [Leptospira santarosai str. HAI134]
MQLHLSDKVELVFGKNIQFLIVRIESAFSIFLPSPKTR